MHHHRQPARSPEPQRLPDSAVTALFTLAVRDGHATRIELLEDVLEDAGAAGGAIAALIGRGFARWTPEGGAVYLTDLGLSQARRHCGELGAMNWSPDEARLLRAQGVRA